MTAQDMISNTIYPAKASDSLQSVLDRMNEYKVKQLPFVRYNQLVGLVQEEDIVTALSEDEKSKLKDVSHELVFVFNTQHLYDVVRVFFIHQLDVLAVVDAKHNYCGCITLQDVIQALAEVTTSDEPGALVVLEVNQRDNSLSHIAQIVESDNAQILSSYIRRFPDSTRMEITIKLNRTDVASIVAAFLRYDYHVKATYNESRVDDSSRDRYEQLINYLNM